MTWPYWNMSKRPLSSWPMPPAPTRPIMLRHRRLRNVELFCGVAEAPGCDYGQKTLNVIEINHSVISPLQHG